ncbi:MAG TPA: riboflavin synthase [Alcanivoracaceae bacterium]|nr:riboflavin synthase [Alcanivoracaceae bacterium]
MFTGIIEAMGRINKLVPTGEDITLDIDTGELDLSDVQLGDSIAVNGVCLTVTQLPGHGFTADASAETLSKTSLGQLRPGSTVNLEKALTPTTRLGGHLVAGHVDGLGEVVAMYDDGRSTVIDIKVPDELAKYIARKGSITVDGISLTTNEVNGAVFSLNIIPHTKEVTTIGQWQVGSKVNIEVDLVARYLERLLLGGKAADASQDAGITLSFLAENGFLKG